MIPEGDSESLATKITQPSNALLAPLQFDHVGVG